MPLYSYKCTECKQELDVLRTFAESDIGPEPEEVETQQFKQPCPEHKWQKVLHKFSVTKGPGWGFGSKGNWLMLLSLLGLSLNVFNTRL